MKKPNPNNAVGDSELAIRIATLFCQFNRITRDMPSAEEIQRALPYARVAISEIVVETMRAK